MKKPCKQNKTKNKNKIKNKRFKKRKPLITKKSSKRPVRRGKKLLIKPGFKWILKSIALPFMVLFQATFEGLNAFIEFLTTMTVFH